MPWSCAHGVPIVLRERMRTSAKTCIGVLYAPRFPLPQAGLSAPSCRRRSSARRTPIGRSAIVSTSAGQVSMIPPTNDPSHNVPTSNGHIRGSRVHCVDCGLCILLRSPIERFLRHIVLKAQKVYTRKEVYAQRKS